MIRTHAAWITVTLAAVSLWGCAPVPDSNANGPDSEWAIEFSSCMAARGWHVDIEWDGGVTGEFTESQREKYRFDTDECSTDHAKSGIGS